MVETDTMGTLRTGFCPVKPLFRLVEELYIRWLILIRIDVPNFDFQATEDRFQFVERQMMLSALDPMKRCVGKSDLL